MSGKFGQLRGQDQTGRTAPDDQDVDLVGQASRPLRDGRMRVLDERVAGLVTVEIELHRSEPSSTIGTGREASCAVR